MTTREPPTKRDVSMRLVPDIWASLGYRMQPSWALPKLLWLLREHRVEKLTSAKEKG
jgi:hypothetical protein